MFPAEWPRVGRCADSPADPSEESPLVGATRSVGEHFEGQDEVARVVILQLEHTQFVGHELEDDVVAGQLDVVTVKMELAFLLAHDADSSG